MTITLRDSTEQEDTMQAGPVGISHFTPGDIETWYQSGERQIFLSDVVDTSNSDTMSVGFAHYGPGESNEWVVAYDEAIIVTRGIFTVASAEGRETTAHAGELIFVRKGTTVVYSAKDEGAEVVYVTYPHWMHAQETSEHAALLDTFHPTDGAPLLTDSIALLQSIWGPLERGESDDSQPFFDALAEDVVFTLSVGEVRGKQAVIDYFVNASATMEFNPFVRPLEYYGDGDRVVILGDEIFRVKESGATHRAEWAWVVDVHDGRITRILGMQDLADVAELVAQALSKEQVAASDQTVPSAEVQSRALD
ncbi:MAG: nuclear transport factor 2 family protein [Acidimicrobiia bacterium]